MAVGGGDSPEISIGAINLSQIDKFPLWRGMASGTVIGAAVMQVLKNMSNLVTWIPTHIEFAVVGAVILLAVVADELVKRAVTKRRLKDGSA